MCVALSADVGAYAEVAVVEAVQSKQSGEANGNCSLSDRDVRQMRELRAASKSAVEAYENGETTEPATLIDWPELGERFGCGPKHAYQLCAGRRRANAGGPIEDSTRPTLAEKLANYIRCPSCGVKYNHMEECQRCQILWAVEINRCLRPFGWVPSVEVVA